MSRPADEWTDPKDANRHEVNERFPTTEDDFEPDPKFENDGSQGGRKETAMRLEDDLAVLEAERVVSHSTHNTDHQSRDHNSIAQTRSHRSHVDEFDEATNPLHERAAAYNPPENPNTKIAAFVKKLHESSFIVRYLTYIVPVCVILLVPLLVGALAFPNASVGGVSLLWFSVWLQIFWLTIWAGRIVAKSLPIPVGILASIFTNNAKKWRDVAKQLQIPATLFFWWLGVEISFLPTMKNHHLDGDTQTRGWERTINKIIISIFVWTVLNFIEKIIIQLIAISFHTRTYEDRIEINKFQIGSLAKLYAFSRVKLADDNDGNEEQQGQSSGNGKSNPLKAPLKYAGKATKVAKDAKNKIGDIAGAVAADFTGSKAVKRNDPHQVVLTLLRSVSGSQVLARRLYRTFIQDDSLVVSDLKEAFDNNEEAEAAFAMFDKDMNGDICMDELEAVCMEIGRERKAITASLKDIDSVVGGLDRILELFIFIAALMVFLSLISTSAAGVLTSAGSTILALSWLLSATAVEFLESIIFVFVKHPFDVGDRVTIYGNSGANGRGDDYFVKHISLLYTEFKKMEGHIVQAPNDVLNSIFILNQRRSGALAEAVPVTIRYGTRIDEIEAFRQRLVEFVCSERREYQSTILTEMREVTDNFSVTLNVVFFYKSNWQNEGLRLQRRNKFISMMMVAMQEIGIQGSRMNWPGARSDIPFHLTGLSRFPPFAAPPGPGHQPPPYPSAPDNRAENHTEKSSSAYHPSPLRKGMDMETASSRSQGNQQPPRKVDFSLGMQAMSSGDVMGDVFDEPTRRVDIVRTATQGSSSPGPAQDDVDDRRSQAHSTGLEGSRSRSSDSSGAAATRRRFFARSSLDRQKEPDVEQGGYHTSNTDLTTAPTVPDHPRRD